jgi:DNA-binding beta-propeller fold protein YncE
LGLTERYRAVYLSRGELFMKTAKTLAVALGVIATAIWAVNTEAAQTTPAYSLVEHLAGSGGPWDYAVVDPVSGRLYLAQQGVTAMDLKTNKITTGLVAGHTTHGVAALGDGTVAVDDSKTKVVTIFDGVSGKVLSTIPTANYNPVNGGHALDALVLEPTSGLLVAINGESGLLLLIDLKRAAVVGTVAVGGHPEFAAADGKGKIYMNVDTGKRGEIAAVDIIARKVVKRMPLRGCDGPTGLAFDEADDLLISVCESGVAKFLHADSGREAASIAVSKGADAVMYDPQRRLAFVPGAEQGILSIIAVRNAADIALVQTLATQRGTRLGAVDIATGRIYLPAAKFGPPVAPSPYPSVMPGSFEFLVVAPN